MILGDAGFLYRGVSGEYPWAQRALNYKFALWDLVIFYHLTKPREHV